MTTECQHKYQLFTSLKGWTCAQCGVEMKQAWVPVAHPQPPATTPAMSRSEMKEKLLKALNWTHAPDDFADRVIDAIHPDLKPAPPKVSENERVAAVIASRWTEHPWTRNECTKEIIAALDARDAQHRLALESLREGMIGGARLWLQTIGHGGSKISDYDYSRLTDILNRVPLATTPEAK